MTLQEILNANPRYAVIPPGIYSLDSPLRVLQAQTAWVKTADCVDVTVTSQITRMK